MERKKTILHIIQNFGIGGAEMAVVGVLKNLHEYNNIVVTLDGLNQFGPELKYDKYYNLNLPSYYLFPLAIRKLRQIIKENNVSLVHSQLYWSTILARFACPKNIPLVTTIQSSLTDSVEYKKKWIGRLDRYSYLKRESTILGVSQHTLDDYFNFLQLPRHNNHVLYNFVDTNVFNEAGAENHRQEKEFRLVTVGNLKPQKNHQFLLDAFMQLKDKGVSLDIFGDGFLQPQLSKYIAEHQLPVRLMGKSRNLQGVLQQYDLFVMSSLYEGFSLAVLEGMVMEKSMLLSDIPTFREQCAGTAEYFSLENHTDFVSKVIGLKNNPSKRMDMGILARNRVLENFTLQHHLNSLRNIYASLLQN
jgi:glycosyltransferase involved in cell wall biosynthesis